MPRKRAITASRVIKFTENGRGIGAGEHYKPWLTIRDYPSKGFSHRVKGSKSSRTHHLFSNLELSFFYWLEWSDKVLDIRERFPLLPIERTLEIADSLKIKHPFDTANNEAIVMTSDFLVDCEINGVEKQKAYSVAFSKNLEHHRFIQKSYIEKKYWNSKGIPFEVVTENEIPENIYHNVNWFWTSRFFENLPIKSLNELLSVEDTLYNIVNTATYSLGSVCIKSDRYLKLRPGSSIKVVKYLIANRFWIIDINRILTTTHPIQFKRNMVELFNTSKGE